jgi:hypothetical protein
LPDDGFDQFGDDGLAGGELLLAFGDRDGIVIIHGKINRG